MLPSYILNKKKSLCSFVEWNPFYSFWIFNTKCLISCPSCNQCSSDAFFCAVRHHHHYNLYPPHPHHCCICPPSLLPPALLLSACEKHGTPLQLPWRPASGRFPQRRRGRLWAGGWGWVFGPSCLASGTVPSAPENSDDSAAQTEETWTALPLPSLAAARPYGNTHTARRKQAVCQFETTNCNFSNPKWLTQRRNVIRTTFTQTVYPQILYCHQSQENF